MINNQQSDSKKGSARKKNVDGSKKDGVKPIKTKIKIKGKMNEDIEDILPKEKDRNKKSMIQAQK